jgi:hypothetical protein
MTSAGTCRDCLHFVNEPARIEAMIPGLATMGSARASVRGDDGICAVHDLIASARDTCGRFETRVMLIGQMTDISRPAGQAYRFPAVMAWLVRVVANIVASRAG